MDFVAIDFETANEQRCSPCSVGLVVVRGGKVVERISRFIRPFDFRFSPFCVRVHGIRPEHVENAPEFPAVWSEIRDYVEGSVVLAHNARFDMDVLRKTLSIYEITYRDICAYCTMEVARTVWPENHYGLADVARHLRIDFNHHEAEEDARVCAEIALTVCRDHRVASIAELADNLHLS